MLYERSDWLLWNPLIIKLAQPQYSVVFYTHHPRPRNDAASTRTSHGPRRLQLSRDPVQNRHPSHQRPTPPLLRTFGKQSGKNPPTHDRNRSLQRLSTSHRLHPPILDLHPNIHGLSLLYCSVRLRQPARVWRGAKRWVMAPCYRNLYPKRCQCGYAAELLRVFRGT